MADHEGRLGSEEDEGRRTERHAMDGRPRSGENAGNHHGGWRPVHGGGWETEGGSRPETEGDQTPECDTDETREKA